MLRLSPNQGTLRNDDDDDVDDATILATTRIFRLTHIRSVTHSRYVQ